MCPHHRAGHYSVHYLLLSTGIFLSLAIFLSRVPIWKWIRLTESQSRVLRQLETHVVLSVDRSNERTNVETIISDCARQSDDQEANGGEGTLSWNIPFDQNRGNGTFLSTKTPSSCASGHQFSEVSPALIKIPLKWQKISLVAVVN